jgi:nucleoside 2-deoxyribosyltransferase
LAFADISFRVRFGVTGHRVLPEPARIMASIREVLDTRIWELFDRPLSPEQRATPLVFTVLTPLAEGADRLVAKEVLKTSNAEIEVVLPLAREDCLRDFAAAESKAEFEELCLKARHVSVLRPQPLARAGSVAELEKEQKRAYEEAGRHVVDHCDVLIAIWDGKPSRGRGGTAEIVAYARGKKRPLIIISSENPDQPIIEKDSGLSSRAYDRIGTFNRYPIPAGDRQAYITKIHEDLFATPEGEKLSDRVKIKIREGLLPWYVRASLIAKRNQNRYFQSGLIVYALSPLAVAAVAVGILVPSWALTAFLFEFIFLLVIYVVIRAADRRKVHKQWIETRFLVERIRSAIFLFSCGVKPAAVSLSSFRQPALRTEEWIVRTFDEIMARAGETETADRDACVDCASFVRARWIGTQIKFHASKAEKAGRLSRLLEKAGRATFLAAIGASAWHLGSFILGHRGFLPALEKPTLFLAIVLPAVGAAIGGARTHREYSRLEKRSRYMEAALHELDLRFAAVAGFNDLEALLGETERLMLQETQDWLMLMRFAKVEAV